MPRAVVSALNAELFGGAVEGVTFRLFVCDRHGAPKGAGGRDRHALAVLWAPRVFDDPREVPAALAGDEGHGADARAVVLRDDFGDAVLEKELGGKLQVHLVVHREPARSLLRLEVALLGLLSREDLDAGAVEASAEAAADPDLDVLFGVRRPDIGGLARHERATVRTPGGAAHSLLERLVGVVEERTSLLHLVRIPGIGALLPLLRVQDAVDESVPLSGRHRLAIGSHLLLLGW